MQFVPVRPQRTDIPGPLSQSFCSELVSLWSDPLCGIISEYRCSVTGTGDGNIAEARVERIGMDAGIGVNQHALGSEPLRAVACDGVAVIEVALFRSAELDLPVIIQPSAFRGVRYNCDFWIKDIYAPSRRSDFLLCDASISSCFYSFVGISHELEK